MDSPQSLASAFILGLFSTVHCVGMCGGIIGALSLSLPETVRQQRLRHIVFISLYNIGRILSYSVAGLIVGYIGAEAAAYTDMSGGPSILRYTGVVLMIAIGLYLAGWFPQLSRVERIGVPVWKVLEPLGRKLVPVTSMPRALLYGIIWGWLPCGMVYFVLVWALTSGSAAQGALTMAAFGLGTLPSLLAAGLAMSSLKRFTQSKTTRQVVGVLVIAMAIATLFMPMGGHKHGQHSNSHGSHEHVNHTMTQ
ncbi:MAG: sulfite exporter TauE/SafE family protein [Gammaproteobacteria bacterium]|jgi:sulfite exporter TauE/SafE